jgi:formate hydrogenlyase subunit 4
VNGYLFLAASLIIGPLFGGLLEGLSRIISARLQGRVGPPILQPFFDVGKLFTKSDSQVTRLQTVHIVSFLFFTIFACAIFFSGGDILLFFFCLTLANVFMVLAGYSSTSPFSHVGAERELIQLLAYEPMFILSFVGIYILTGSFVIKNIMAYPHMIFWALPGCLIGMIPIILIKLQKSPFDLSSSHHPHQELVKGISSDFSGPTLGLIEIAHWYKYSYLTAFIALFFGSVWWAGLLGVAVVYLVIVFIDNAFGRFTYRQTLKSVWSITLVFGFGNIFVLYLVKYFIPVLSGSAAR